MTKFALLITLCAGSLLTSASENHQLFSNSTKVLNLQSDEIDLRGRIEPGEIRREVKAISAYMEDSYIKAQFHFDMGSVQITIANDLGIILYTSTISNFIGETLIPVSNLPAGNYSISFTASNGTMTGEFML
ncbi:hypothetical protein BWD42_06820 [Sphingobacterium sp. CZ-UAM]|uniref:DUF3244 domain-containing protein n=1 Tax=Sphingobacterium sp. CZ-UAM TaxID=1933868 RepID=UPI000985C6D3|nr:DUF3244 domain-containing protein [Sphingobacterium sp. CZ-UAM]OOG19618.1 hypothetical protein BWD42_06820 [Sphingobacterium sp. CZ-UAM]